MSEDTYAADMAAAEDALAVAHDALRAWVDWCAASEAEINGAIALQTIRSGVQAYTGAAWPLRQTRAALGMADGE